ncbi:rho GTPase-activating protein 100F isoform X3 [Bemisia tabaci]|uniref:rho GTPase-activating protein 100F isoform X3 n=1 Tax=Bemisia tabaci TaxID=7038 RepID=UPI0008F9A48F|nr:PREDICTED: rho GTPase-activating protein 100F-like isoform X3 [Bemisia tabaci]
MCDKGSSSGCFFTRKGRETQVDLATSPRRQPQINNTNMGPRPKDPLPMVVQGDFRKVSGISNEIFRQIETIENELDGSIAAALASVERRGEMVVRMLDYRSMGKNAAELAKRFLSMQDAQHSVHFVEIVKRPGQTLGLYIREGNGVDRADGVFISRIALESAVYNSGCLKVGDEILAVNLVDVTRMSLDDVVIIMSIPRRLVLATRQVKGLRQAQGTPSQPRALELKVPPVVVIKKSLTREEDQDDEEDEENNHRFADLNRESKIRGRVGQSRSHLALGSLDTNGDIGSGALYYNSRPHAATVHPFNPGNGPGSSYGAGSSRYATTGRSSSRLSNRGPSMPRSGSDQHLPRVEYDYGNGLPARHSGSLLRSSLRASTGMGGSYSRSRDQYNASPSSTLLPRRQRPALDYASDTEATCSSSSRASYYYCRPSPPVSSLTRGVSFRSNSLPRHSLTSQSSGRTPLSVRFERNNLLDEGDSDGALSAPELPIARKHRGRLSSTPSVFTSDEYRAWLSRTPSTSAIYDRLRAGQQKAQRFTFSAENLPERTRQSELLASYRSSGLSALTGLSGLTSSTLDRHTLANRTTSLRRMRHLLELEAKHQADRAKIMEINPAEFLKYKMEKWNGPEPVGASGLLWVHLLAGRGLRNPSPSQTTGNRDLYCVLECDRVHKARTVVRTGDLVFDWDETFELDLVGNKQLDFLIYSWDPQYRHKLCYKGSVHLASLLRDSPIHQLALKIEPRGTLYLRLRHTSPYRTFLRQSRSATGLFGGDLEATVAREGGSIPIIVRRCVEEVERRGLDIIGLYRLCGSATKKRILREAFERNARIVDLSPDHVPDINVITGVLKDYLRELPEPLFTKCLYQMMVDALTVCLPDDPEGNAKLMFSILDCLPRINKATLVFLLDHLAMVVGASGRNKMCSGSVASCLAPVLILHSESATDPMDFMQPISVLRYLLDIWPNKSVRDSVGHPVRPSKCLLPQQPPPLPAKPVGFRQTSGPVVVASPTSDTSPEENDEQDDVVSVIQAHTDSKPSPLDTSRSDANLINSLAQSVVTSSNPENGNSIANIIERFNQTTKTSNLSAPGSPATVARGINYGQPPKLPPRNNISTLGNTTVVNSVTSSSNLFANSPSNYLKDKNILSSANNLHTTNGNNSSINELPERNGLSNGTKSGRENNPFLCDPKPPPIAARNILSEGNSDILQNNVFSNSIFQRENNISGGATSNGARLFSYSPAISSAADTATNHDASYSYTNVFAKTNPFQTENMLRINVTSSLDISSGNLPTRLSSQHSPISPGQRDVETPSSSTGTEEDSRRERGVDADQESSEEDLK